MNAPYVPPSPPRHRFNAVQRGVLTAGLGTAACLITTPLAWRPSPAAAWALLGSACLFGFVVGFALRSWLGVLTWPVIGVILIRLFFRHAETGGGFSEIGDGAAIVLCGVLGTIFGLAGVGVAWLRSLGRP